MFLNINISEHNLSRGLNLETCDTNVNDINNDGQNYSELKSFTVKSRNSHYTPIGVLRINTT